MGAGVGSWTLGVADPSIQRRCHNVKETAQTANAAKPVAPGRGMASGAIIAAAPGEHRGRDPGRRRIRRDEVRGADQRRRRR